MEHVCDCTPPQGHSQPNYLRNPTCPIHGEAAAAIEIRDRSLAIAAALDVDRAMPWRELVEVVRATRIKRDQVIAQLERALVEERGKVEVQPKVTPRVVDPTARDHAREEHHKRIERVFGKAPTGAAPGSIDRTITIQLDPGDRGVRDPEELRRIFVEAFDQAQRNLREPFVPAGTAVDDAKGLRELKARVDVLADESAGHDAASQRNHERIVQLADSLRAERERVSGTERAMTNLAKNVDSRISDASGVASDARSLAVSLVDRISKLEGWRKRISSRPNGADVLVSLDKRTDERDWLVKRVEERLDALEKLAQGTADALDTHKTLAHERLDELEEAWGRAPLREWVESKFDVLEKRVDEDRVAQYAFDEFKAAVETWQAAHAQTVANLAKNVASIDLAFGGLAAAVTTGRDAVSDWQKKVDETVRQFGEAGNLLRGDVAELTKKTGERLDRIESLLAEDYDRIVALQSQAPKAERAELDAVVRRADSGAEALVQLGVLVSELRAKVDRIDGRTRTPGVRSNDSKKLIPLESTEALVTCARDVVDVRGVIGDVPHHSLRSRIDELGRALANFEGNTKAGT